MTTSSAASDEIVAKLVIFPLQCLQFKIKAWRVRKNENTNDSEVFISSVQSINLLSRIQQLFIYREINIPIYNATIYVLNVVIHGQANTTVYPSYSVHRPLHIQHSSLSAMHVGTRRNNNVIITSKRRSDVVLT